MRHYKKRSLTNWIFTVYLNFFGILFAYVKKKQYFCTKLQKQRNIMMPATKQTLTITFDPRNVYVQSFLQTMRLSKAFIVEECPYDPLYVARAQKAMKGKFVEKKIEDIWK